MIISERQAGVAEKGEVRLPPEAHETPAHRLTQRCDVGGADVGQFPAFDFAPYLFDRVQLRRVPGQAFDRQPGRLSAHVGLHGPALVGAKSVPEGTSLALQITGGRGAYKDYPVERAFRDMRTASLMPPTMDRMVEGMGKLALGLGGRMFQFSEGNQALPGPKN